MSNRRGVLESTRPDQYIGATVASDGTATGYIGPCPEGFEWYVERMTCAQSGAGVSATTALLEIYVQQSQNAPGDASKQGRQDIAVGTAVANDVSDNLSPIVVPPGMFLVAYWTGLTSGDLVKLSTQIQVRRLVIERASVGTHAHGIDHRGDAKAGDMRAIIPVDTVAEV